MSKNNKFYQNGTKLFYVKFLVKASPENRQKPTEPDRCSYCSLNHALFQTKKSNVVKTIVSGLKNLTFREIIPSFPLPSSSPKDKQAWPVRYRKDE